MIYVLIIESYVFLIYSHLRFFFSCVHDSCARACVLTWVRWRLILIICFCNLNFFFKCVWSTLSLIDIFIYIQFFSCACLCMSVYYLCVTERKTRRTVNASAKTCGCVCTVCIPLIKMCTHSVNFLCPRVFVYYFLSFCRIFSKINMEQNSERELPCMSSDIIKSELCVFTNKNGAHWRKIVCVLCVCRVDLLVSYIVFCDGENNIQNVK